MKTKAASLIFIFCTAIACATLSVKKAIGPDGQSMYEAVCRGGGYTFANCMNEAARVCGGPYEVLEVDTQVTQTTIHTRVVTVATSPDMKRKGMVFRCRKSNTDLEVSED